MSITTIAAQAPAAQAPAAQATVAQRPNDFVPSKAAQAKPAQEAPATISSAEQKQQLEAAVKAVAQFAKPMAGNLEFSLDDETGKTVVKVVDATTNELIRQIPSEEMLEIARALDRLQGILVRQKA